MQALPPCTWLVGLRQSGPQTPGRPCWRFLAVLPKEVEYPYLHLGLSLPLIRVGEDIFEGSVCCQFGPIARLE